MNNYKKCNNTIDLSQSVTLTARQHATRVIEDGGVLNLPALVSFLEDYYNRFGTLASITYSPQADIFGYKIIGDGQYIFYSLFKKYDVIVNSTDLEIANIEGKSAYEVAVLYGYQGTPEEWLNSLKGANGKDGINGKDGKDGAKGDQGIQGEKGERGDQGLKGDKGEKGDKGDQGEKGADGKDGKDGINGVTQEDVIFNIEIHNSDKNAHDLNARLATKADKTYVDEAVANIEVDTTNLATKEELATKADKTYVDEAVANVSVDLTGYATETWVGEQGYLTEHQDISGKADKTQLVGLASETYVNEAVDGIDLSNFVTKIDGKGLSTNDFTTPLLNKLNSLSNYEDTEVRNLIKSIQESLALLTNNEDIEKTINSIKEFTDFLDGITNEKTLISLLTTFDTNIKNWVKNQGYLTEHQDISGKADKTELVGLATEAYVDEAVSNVSVDLTPYLTKTEASTTYVTKVDGKGLSTNDFTTPLLNKLNSLSNYDDTDINFLIGVLSSDMVNVKNDLLFLDSQLGNISRILDNINN